MNRALDMVRNGNWLTRERIRMVAVALLFASAAGFLYLVVTARGGIDVQGRPLGTDFSDVYAAGTYVRDGHPEAPFDPAQQYHREQALFGAATPFYGWHYPPYFLFIAAALAMLPYGLALAVWQAVSLGLYVVAIRAILSSLGGPGSGSPQSVLTGRREQAPKPCFGRRWLRIPDGRFAASGMTMDWLLLAVAFPAVLINIGHGQNGFLTAALLGGALAMLDGRPLAAGILFGLLAYKPQFGLMIPIALAAGGYWRSFAAAAATVAALTLATTLAFGPQVWTAFLASTEFSRTVVLEQGSTGWPKIQSLFSWARMWGAPVPLAYGIQGLATVALGAALARLWRGPAPLSLKAAALCLAALLATPYSLDYDMMVLAPAIAFLAVDGFERGFGPWQKSAMAALWLAPLVARSVAQATLLPLGVPAMLAAFAVILQRAKFGFSAPAVLRKESPEIAAGAAGTSHRRAIAP